MESILAVLNQPMHDTCSLRKSSRGMALIALFVAGFLWFFEPFGFSRYPGNLPWLAVRFGMITFIAGFLVEFIEIRILKLNKEHPSWTFGRWILRAVIGLLAISMGNFLFVNYLSGWDDLTFSYFLRFIINTVAIGIFPLIAIGYTSLRQTQRSNEALARKIEVHPTHHNGTVKVENNTGDDLILELHEILYMEAMQNYVAVYTITNGHLEKTMVRNTLKNVLQGLPEHAMFRCHRSFIVNLDHINDVTGNAQGLLISFTGFPGIIVPVSRKYISELRKIMEAA